MYIGLSKPAKEKPRTEGGITTPAQVTQVQSMRQITVVQDFLIEQIQEIKRGSIKYDLAIFTNTFSSELFDRLQSQ